VEAVVEYLCSVHPGHLLEAMLEQQKQEAAALSWSAEAARDLAKGPALL
jgi:hypothetical protein